MFFAGFKTRTLEMPLHHYVIRSKTVSWVQQPCMSQSPSCVGTSAKRHFMSGCSLMHTFIAKALHLQWISLVCTTSRLYQLTVGREFTWTSRCFARVRFVVVLSERQSCATVVAAAAAPATVAGQRANGRAGETSWNGWRRHATTSWFTSN